MRGAVPWLIPGRHAGQCSTDAVVVAAHRLGKNVPMPGLDPALAARLKRNADGLVAAVVQQHDTGEVLMLGWMDDEALHRTLTTGRATYWSRSRKELWRKGDTSGKVMKPAKLANGFEVQVPLFVTTGDRIEIDTRTGEYKRRV